jgi:cyclophilin family peptidyl-prolyl cis-trans isomerase
MKNIIIPLIFIIAIVAAVTIFSKPKAVKEQPKKEEDKMQNNHLKFPGILADEKIKNKKAVIKTAKGTIEVELYADKAPKTVSNFIYLTEQKFYDGLTFHRVEPGFVIQGGDPQGTGMGGPGYQFEDEPVIGEYKKGTIAMANAGPNTNGSQFFICLDDLPTLPKSYSLFGQVISGMDIIDQIQVGDKMESITIENM